MAHPVPTATPARLLATIAGLVLLLAFGCTDGEPPHPPAPIASATPATTLTPTSTSTPAATPATLPPRVTALLDTVERRDAAALVSMLRFMDVPCTDQVGAGGPPKCWVGGRDSKGEGAPPPLPDGTVVEVFPLSSCEFGWYEPAGARDALRSLIPSLAEPYAVLRLVRPLFDETHTDTRYPSAEFAVVFVRRASGQPDAAAVFTLDDRGVTHLDLSCQAEPAEVLARSPRYRDAELLARGPRLDAVTPTPQPVPPVTSLSPPVRVDTRFKDQTGYFRIPPYDDRRLSPEQKAADPARDPRWPAFIRCMERRGVRVPGIDPDTALQADVDRLLAEVNTSGPFFTAQPSGLRYRPTAPSDAFLACERVLWSPPAPR